MSIERKRDDKGAFVKDAPSETPAPDVTAKMKAMEERMDAADRRAEAAEEAKKPKTDRGVITGEVNVTLEDAKTFVWGVKADSDKGREMMADPMLAEEFYDAPDGVRRFDPRRPDGEFFFLGSKGEGRLLNLEIGMEPYREGPQGMGAPVRGKEHLWPSFEEWEGAGADTLQPTVRHFDERIRVHTGHTFVSRIRLFNEPTVALTERDLWGEQVDVGKGAIPDDVFHAKDGNFYKKNTRTLHPNTGKPLLLPHELMPRGGDYSIAGAIASMHASAAYAGDGMGREQANRECMTGERYRLMVQAGVETKIATMEAQAKADEFTRGLDADEQALARDRRMVAVGA